MLWVKDLKEILLIFVKVTIQNIFAFKVQNIINYFNSWNYNFNDERKNIEELSKGKTVFFISRNEGSPNLFHGFSEIINFLSIMYIKFKTRRYTNSIS